MDKFFDFFSRYHDRIMHWYGALTFLEQMGVLFGLFIAAFGLVAFFLIRK
jgi:hypothetical protein